MHHKKDNNYSNLNTLSTTPPSTNPLSLYLHTSTRPEGSDFSTSPLSSAATSPASSPPTSPFRRGMYRNLSRSPDNHDNRSQSPLRLPASLRRSSLVVLRGRPSAVDLALSEERSRCDEDSVERQGIDLMEPRPVDPLSIPMDLDANVFPTSNCNASRGSFQSMTQVQSPAQGQARSPSHPRFVMGGIFEVMEGSA
ncbi:hypothetical protein PHISCL_01258 [Aspergillus sclerotialis]|uniref:Uncharacterized protein n=1 Tax=Aspergillus sclerotialis TaxID=2070753 RepID=A0A3A3AAI7_9EURO|nr:hypothetical protein PHISCL_01258 [Aspergillus sclerotialis]